MSRRRPVAAIINICTVLVLVISAPIPTSAQTETPTPSPGTDTPVPTLPPGTETATATPTATDEPIAPTDSATETLTPSVIPTEEQPTPTSTPTQEAATATSGPSETPTGSATATEGTIEPTATASPSPSETPTEPASATATATASATATVTSTATASVIQLSMTPTPQFAVPGGMATLHWFIEGIDPAMHALELRMKLPADIEPQAGEGNFDTSTHTLAIAATTARGQFQLSVSEVAGDTSFQVDLVEGDAKLATDRVSILTHEEFTVGTNGGAIQASRAGITINFPPGALLENARIAVGRPSGALAPRSSLSGRAFQITAKGLESSTDIQQFGQAITLEASYADFGIAPGRESQTYIWWYDPETEAWAALPSHADPATGMVQATTDHLTVFDISLNDWAGGRMPTVDGFQVARFTGAGTFSLPIEVPEGPGGLKPDLTLSYNSQVVDQSRFESQPDWVGMGWSLDTGQIDLDDHGTDATTDDSWLLNAGGVSTRIVKNTDGYHAMDENYWKISYNQTADTWTVWDKVGNIYEFEDRSEFNYGYVGNPCGEGNDAPTQLTYRWSLTHVQNLFGKELAYTYVKEGKCVGLYWSDTAIYPDKIVYPGGRQRVRFVREARNDYPQEWDSDGANHTFQRSRLKSIRVEVDEPGNGTFTILRRYILSYAADSDPNIIFPGHTFTKGSKASTLLSVEMNGVGGGGTLPPYEFTYRDHLHLTVGARGSDAVPLASVTLGYEGSLYVGGAASEANTKTLFLTDRNAANSWTAYAGDVFVGFGEGALEVSGGTATLVGLGKPQLWRPGGVYKLTAHLQGGVPPTGVTVRVGMNFGAGGVSYLCGSGETCTQGNINAPGNASKAEPLLQVNGGAAYFTQFDYQLMPSFYRVMSRTVNDGNNHNYGWTYTYGSPAMNNSTNSPCGSTCNRYFPLYREYRGHASVTETGPDGKKTVTVFGQDDATRGRTLSVTIKTSALTVLAKTLYEYETTALPVSSLSSYDDVHRYWTRTVSEENRTYHAGGAGYAGKKKEFSYGTAFGNVTNEKDSAWDEGISDWVDHHDIATEYFPLNSGGLYLVSLPARETVRDPSGTRLAQRQNLYDGHATYNTQPSVGKLTDVRIVIDATRTSQVTYGYDSWGNRNAVTTYEGYGTESSDPSGSSYATYTCYGSGGMVGGKWCEDDGFHSFARWRKNAKGQITTWTYDYEIGQPTSQADANDIRVRADYDAFGRIRHVFRPPDPAEQPTLTMTYTDGTNGEAITAEITQLVDATVSPIQTYSVLRTYDGLGRMIRTSDSGSVATDYEYDAYGRVVKQYTPHSNADPPVYFTETTYNVLGRARIITAPDGTQTTYNYDALETTMTDAKGYVTVTEQDVWGNTKSVTPPTGPGILYDYDPLGNLLSVALSVMQGAQPPNTEFTYDRASRRTSMTDADLGHWTYDYDGRGNLETQSDARGCTLSMTYDELNRLRAKESNGTGCGTQVDWTYYYDEASGGPYSVGRRTSIGEGSSRSSTWTYDERGRVLSESKAINGGGTFTTRWTYNSADQPTSMTYPGGETVGYAYNNRMLVTQVSNATKYLESATYDSASRPTARTLGDNVLSQSYTYYPWTSQGGRLQHSAAGTLQNLTYTYDAVGNIKTIADGITGVTSEYANDGLNRLESLKVDGVTTETYTYDPATGNLASKGGVTYDVYSPGHDHAVTSLSNGDAYTYDANGNMLTRTVNGQTFTLGYDAENRLISVSGAVTASFVYDGDGNRVKATIGGVSTYFVGNIYEKTGEAETKYYYAGAQRIAMRIPGTLYYLLADHLGSTTVTTTATGGFDSEVRYDPWGKVMSGSSVSGYTYTGQYSNVNDFGLMYYNARWYDPALGRFAQADSVVPPGAQGWDRYAYVGNNPVNNVDPSGHKLCDAEFGCDDETSSSTSSEPQEQDDLAPALDDLSSCESHACWSRYKHTLFYGFSTWEIMLLMNLAAAGPEGMHAAQYLYANSIDFDNLSYQWTGTGARWNWDGTISFPDTAPLPSANDPFTIGLIAHETMHLEQGWLTALTAYGELQAWQVGFRVQAAAQYPIPLLDTQQAIVRLPLNYDRATLMVGIILMERDQHGRYLGGYLLPLAMPRW